MVTSVDKFVVAFVGLLLVMLKEWGLDLTASADAIASVLIPAVTAFFVWFVPNKVE